MQMLSRRSFVVRAGLASAAVAASGFPSLAWADPLGLPIGIQLYTVGADLRKDAPATVKQIAQIGYKEVETAGFGSLKTATEFRKLLDDNGLKCPSAHLQFDLNNLQKTFDDAKALGCTYATSSVPRSMLQPPRPTPPAGPQTAGAGAPAAGRTTGTAAMMAPMTPDEFKKLSETLNKVGAAAKAAGLTYASHNHTMEFAMVDGMPGYDYMIQHTDPKLVKFEIDCGWMSVAGYNPVDYVNKYPGRIKMLHIKDFLPFQKGPDLGPGKVQGSEIGKGVVDYKAIFKGVAGKGIEHIFVEQEGPYSRVPAMEAAKIDYQYLHSLS
jgi:sugar phosphate isomerase/epimerase